MAVYRTNLRASDDRIEGLMADFSGLQNLEKAVNSVLERLKLDASTQTNLSMVRSGTMSKEQFDGWFSELIRKELGKVLAIMRAKAVQRARGAGAGSASSAVLRRMYKDRFGGNINIASPRGRISNRTRNYQPGWLKPRYVGDRTKKINEYYGPDRGFVLRFLEGGTDVRTATSYGPKGKGSMASWGARGSIAPRSFFHGMGADMEQAAQQLGHTLNGYVENWLVRTFKEG